MRFFVNLQRILAPLAFILVGLIFVVVSIVILCQPKVERLSVTGTIVRIDEYRNGEDIDYTVYVDYEVNGQKYSSAVYPAYSSSMKQGSEVEILYDPANPSDIEAPGSASVPYVLLGAGIVAMLVGGFIFIRTVA